MADAADSKNTISLKPVDGEILEVPPAIAKQMQTVQFFIEEDSFTASSSVIPLPNVTAFQLSKIIEYLNYHNGKDKPVADDNEAKEAAKEAAKEFNKKFVNELSHDQLKELILATNYLNVKDVLEFLNQTVADLIANKSVEFVRNFFGIVSDYTADEEAELRQKNSWAFEGVDVD